MAEKYRKPNGDINRNTVSSIVSVNKWEDVKKVEEIEDCFILEFDPTIISSVCNNDDIDDDDDDVKIIGSVVCVKKREDVKKVEELEDCFILEFDPCEEVSIGVHFSKLSVSVKTEVVSDDEDVSILAVKGKVACRDYPHPRHLCAMHPFKKTPHEIHCRMKVNVFHFCHAKCVYKVLCGCSSDVYCMSFFDCYCYVCDRSAPCKKWTKGCKDPSLKHCDATPDIALWRRRRDRKKQRSEGGSLRISQECYQFV